MGYMAQIATNVIYVKVLVIGAKIFTTLKDNSNMQICERSLLYSVFHFSRLQYR